MVGDVIADTGGGVQVVHIKMMIFAFKMMDFVFKMMDFVFKMMDFVFKMTICRAHALVDLLAENGPIWQMKFVLHMMNFVFKMTDLYLKSSFLYHKIIIFKVCNHHFDFKFCV